jgi:hypothetical protein
MAGSSGWKSYYSITGNPPLPVSVDQIIGVASIDLITSTGEGYQVQEGQWISMGLVPGGPTPVTQTTFGALKAKYR